MSKFDVLHLQDLLALTCFVRFFSGHNVQGVPKNGCPYNSFVSYLLMLILLMFYKVVPLGIAVYTQSFLHQQTLLLKHKSEA